jgi:peptidoglycan/xylan/chitin deacetylase (PgdA/CDA1 family)
MSVPVWPNSARSAISLTFDDGYSATWKETVERLHTRGIAATYNVLTGYVGASFEGLPTAKWADWRQALALGHEIASHGENHVPLAGLFNDLVRFFRCLHTGPDRRLWLRFAIARFRALAKWKPETTSQARPWPDPLIEVATSYDHIVQQVPGAVVESFAYPSGRHNAAARRAVVTAGYYSARGNDYGLNYHNSDRFALRAVALGEGLSLEDLNPLLARSLSTGGWLILALHLVSQQDTSGYPYWLSTGDFSRLLDQIQKKPFWIAPQAEIARMVWPRDSTGEVA